MKTFEYKGFDHGGRAAKGLIEAMDLKEARDKLSTRGILPETITSAGDVRHSSGRKKDVRFGLGARAMVYRELAALLRAELPLANSLEVLIEAPELGALCSRLAGVRDALRDGSSFAHAFSSAGKNVSAFERSVIEVGERTGNLDEVLERLALFMEEQHRLQERIRTALIYPAIVVSLALLIALFILGFMVPAIGKLLQETHIPLPLLTRCVIVGGKVLFAFGLPVVLALAVAGFFVRRRLLADAELRGRWDRRLFKLPMIGRGYLLLVNLRFARTLALLMQGGVPLLEGLELAGRATGSSWISELAVKGAEELRHGKSLAEVVRSIEPFSASLPGWIQAGEASGKLEGLLESAGLRYQQQWDQFVARRISILEPLLILLVGGFVLLISLSILLPILSLNSALK